MSADKDLLVVEDEPVIAQAVVKICSAEGLRVDAAERASAGLELLEKASYHLILCDIMMTDLDGFQFLAELGKRGVRTPLVMKTGFATVENAVRSLSLGAVDFIPIPFTADEQMAEVRRGMRCGGLSGPMDARTGGQPSCVTPPPGDPA